MQNDLKLPALELQIIRHLWALGSRATVQEILDTWEEAKKPLYTTILKKLQVMEGKELVRHEKEGKAYKYIPLLTREEISRKRLKGLIKNFFNHNKLELIHTFLDETELDSIDIEAIRRMLAEKEKEGHV